ncbi:MAG: PEP/pyruvate-binding domain-containing protein [Promethearchaeota archaeon]
MSFRSNIKSFISDLSSQEQEDLTLGSKALNLRRLIRYNFSVPEGFVIKTDAYTQFLDNNHLNKIVQEALERIKYDDYEAIEECSRTINNAIMQSKLPLELIEELKIHYNKYSSYGVAVRSSATAEDQPTASFAGQYDTYLNLKNLNQILDHIKKCYASLWTIRAIRYRFTKQIPHEKVKIAIIVQKMVSAKSAGVLFTSNPIGSRDDEVLIESNFGLGESIVAGKISPDQFSVRRLKQGSFRILNKRIGNKTFVAIPISEDNKEGVEYLELSDDLTHQASLSDSDILNLTRIGFQIERVFRGIPQDIEWAIDQKNQIKILQTRPITTIKSKGAISDILWTRGYSDDYWNDNVTPLYFELLGDQLTKVVNMELNSIMGYKQMDPQLLKLYKAHVYFNLNVLKRKVENEIPKFIRNDDVLNYFPEGSGSFGKKVIKELPFHLVGRIVAELRVGIFDPKGGISKTAEAYERWTKERFNPYCREFDKKLDVFIKTGNMGDLINLAKELDTLMIDHFRLVRYGIPVHNIGMNLITQYLLRRFLGEKDSSRYYPILISGLEHKLTETNDQIFYLASVINKTPEVKSIIISEKSENLYKILLDKTELPIKNFMIEFEKFLIEHGDRGFTREAYYPRWKEPPMVNVFDILKSLVVDGGDEYETIKARSSKNRKRFESIVKNKIRTQRFGFIKWKIFSIFLKNSRKYIVFRENQRFNLDKWITRNRFLFLELGRKLTKIGVLPDENKIFFLKKKELKNLESNKYEEQEIQHLSSKIIRRFDHFKTHENKLPPKFLLGSQEFDDELKHDKNSVIFTGVPASQGVFTAPIRVLNDISLISTVQSKEILVVPQTDPGWTPVFSIIGGLITETGGILSHGAVVSREYGIPAVTNVTNACKIFKTGQFVKINGDNGTVILQK